MDHDQHSDSIMDRLVRIETRIVKIMEALNLDPRTGALVRKQPARSNDRKDEL